MLDIKLYLLDEIRKIGGLTDQLFQLLIRLANQHKNVLLTGYTHFQIAMPSSFGLWFGAYAEALTNDAEMLLLVNIINENPLGSAAVTVLPYFNRESTTYHLNFKTLNYNSVYAQMTRGKSEKLLASAMAVSAGTLSRFLKIVDSS